MSENILFKEEISTALLRLASHTKEVIWTDLLTDMKEFILSKYDGKAMTRERGDCKRRLKATAKALGIKIIRFNEDAWKEIESALQILHSQHKSSSKSSSTNYKLTDDEKKKIMAAYSEIKASDYWVLSTGTAVDEKMKAFAELSIYEHPVHSMIMDPDDVVWIGYFTLEELNETKSYNTKHLEQIPDDLSSCLNLYDQEWNNGLELYDFANSQKYHPIKDFEKKWVRESMIGVSELFLHQDSLLLHDYSEADLLNQVWRFIYRQFPEGNSRALLGERCSIALATAKNIDQSLEGEEKRVRKAMGAKLDILFKNGSDELGSCEVGKECVVVAGDKYIDDVLVKLPKTLRDMLMTLAEKNPDKVNQLRAVGFLMMGLDLELVVMDIPKGKSIARVSKTARFQVPSCIQNVALDFIPMLETAWKSKQTMKDTVATLNSRKRRATELSVIAGNSS